MRELLSQLANRAWFLHSSASPQAAPHVVRPSIPILYFGDSIGFAASPLRVVTVGLNPSREEFPMAAPFKRFPGAERLGGDRPDLYLSVLDAYFVTQPYSAWFRPSFEPILRGLGASYYGSAPSLAIHTDMCTVLATDPTWSGLPLHERQALEPTGQRLWHDLLDVLMPDIALISVARHRLSRIEFHGVGSPFLVQVIDGPERSRPYRVEAFRVELSSGKRTLFIFGAASQTPFGSISGAAKEVLGAQVAKALNA